MSGAVRSNPYDHPAYLAAAAAHLGGEVIRVDGGLHLLCLPDGTLRTVPGHPQPTDPLRAAIALAELDDWTVTLATLGPAAELATHLGAPIADRSLAVVRLDAGSGPRAGGGRLDIGALDPCQLAEDHPDYGEDYFAALAEVPHFAVTVHDDHGRAAWALWLDGDPAVAYHLGGERRDPAPADGALQAVLLGGLREAANRGAQAALLGLEHRLGQDRISCRTFRAARSL